MAASPRSIAIDDVGILRSAPGPGRVADRAGEASGSLAARGSGTGRQHGRQGRMDRFEVEVAQGIVQGWDTAPAEGRSPGVTHEAPGPSVTTRQSR